MFGGYGITRTLPFGYALSFYERAEAAISQCKSQDVIGELNPKVDECKVADIVGPHGLGADCGGILVDWCKENEMVIANTIVCQSQSKETTIHGSVQI